MAVGGPGRTLGIDGGCEGVQGSLSLIFFLALAWKVIFRASWDGFRGPFSDILAELKKHQTLLEKEGHLANFENVNLMRKDLEKRDENVNRVIKDLEERDEQSERQKLVNAYRWLSAADYSADHDHLLSLRKDFPDTCKWLFQKREMISWHDSNSEVSIFWLHGILGSGTYHPIQGPSFDCLLCLIAVIRKDYCRLLCC